MLFIGLDVIYRARCYLYGSMLFTGLDDTEKASVPLFTGLDAIYRARC